MRVAVVLALGAAVTAAAGAAPRPHVERARLGSVEATFSYTYNRAKFRFANQHLTIRRAGSTRFSARLRRLCDYCDVQPANFWTSKRSVSIRDLDGDGEPEVLLDLYWGGAHCCWYTEIYRYAGTYRRLSHVWGNPDYKLRYLDGLPEFVTGDDRFAYAFASFADSTWPVRILRYRAGRFAFVTTAYPREIGRDATRQWRWAMARKKAGDNQGILAAWAADECMLDHCAAAFATIDHLARTGRLHGEASAPKYMKHLRRFLRRTGYL